MIGRYDTGDDCTAAVGVMGWTSCHKYPGCGCGGSNSNEAAEFQARQEQYEQDKGKSFERNSDWHIRTFHKIEMLSKGYYRIWLNKNSYAENYKYFPCKVDGNKLIFHKTIIKNNLKEYFTVIK